MHKRLAQSLDMYHFPLSVLIYCTIGMRIVLEQEGNNGAVELADQARAKQEHARELEFDWEKQKKSDPLRRDGAKKLDNEIDQGLSRLAQTIEGFATAGTDTELTRLATQLHEDLFPNGVFYITSKAFNTQHVRVNELIGRLRGEYAENIQKLNLGAMVDRIEELNTAFGEKLTPESERIEYNEVEEALVEAEDAFHLLVARVMADYGDEMETFNRVMARVHEQTERTRRHLNRRGTAPEVDPETGEPIDDEIPPVEPGDDSPSNDGGRPSDDNSEHNPLDELDDETDETDEEN